MELVSIHIGLFQLAHPSRMIHIFKAKLLLYTHCLLQFSIKKCIFYIQLLQFPPFSLDQSQHNPYCLRFDNRRKCFNIVNALHLITSLTYNPSLILIKQTFILHLRSIQPFVINGITLMCIKEQVLMFH